ncbi:hypothetical protein [uncultured Nevskia sp.]|uniref:hypothetical protein n=1 Tax=uncultured Nevskia sp. TaxID=228950 RepID=UPI0025D1E1DB|nr:hypothetical protein [uncultured Nevskia sp.]
MLASDHREVELCGAAIWSGVNAFRMFAVGSGLQRPSQARNHYPSSASLPSKIDAKHCFIRLNICLSERLPERSGSRFVVVGSGVCWLSSIVGNRLLSSEQQASDG